MPPKRKPAQAKTLPAVVHGEVQEDGTAPVASSLSTTAQPEQQQQQQQQQQHKTHHQSDDDDDEIPALGNIKHPRRDHHNKNHQHNSHGHDNDDHHHAHNSTADDKNVKTASDKKKAWHDDDDDDVRRVPAFVRNREAPAKPAWAQRRRTREEQQQDEQQQKQQGAQKNNNHGGAADEDDIFFEDATPANDAARQNKTMTKAQQQQQQQQRKKSAATMHDEASHLLRTALASTEPTLTSLNSEAALLHPRPSSTIMLPQEKIRDLCWHPTSPSLLCVTTSKMVHTFHVSGKFTEKMTSWRIPGKGLAQSALLQRGEKIIVLPEGAYVPLSVELATGNIEALNFLDMRSSSAAVLSVRGTATDAAPTVVAALPGDDANEIVAIPCGSSLNVASTRHGTMMHTITAPGVIADAVFTSDTEVAVAVPNSTVLFYDIRRMGRCVRKLQDPAALQITRLAATGSNLVVGTASGVVSVYSLSGVAASSSGVAGNNNNQRQQQQLSLMDPTPAYTFQNLTTSIDLLACGKTSRRTDTAAVLFGSSSQQAGFRLATLPNGRVVPRFPSVSMHHQFLTCVAYSSGSVDPTVSVGEFGRIVNYAC